MKTLVTADLHLSANPRDAYRHTHLRKLVRIAKDRGVGRTIILGDLTEEKDRHTDWLTNAVVEHVKAFAELGDVIINMGNHDYASDPDVPFFRFLRHMPKVRFITKPTSLSAIGLGSVLFLPFCRDHKREWMEVSFKGNAYCFTHCTFEGTDLGNNRKTTGGVSSSIFPKGSVVISGDVHVPQSIGCVMYVGAPYLIDFGDRYKPRCLIIEDDVVESVPLKGPQKRLIELDGAKDELDQIDDINKGDILKIRVHLPRTAADKWPAERDKLRAHYEGRGCVVHSIVPVISDKLGPKVKHVQSDAKSDAQVMKEFARHRGIDRPVLRYGERLAESV